ncbi:MAG TPA: hypothetical protein VFU15_07660 [Bacteroidia bacterium]|nr:hypothetical protein [Bacteroidia bacterium]
MSNGLTAVIMDVICLAGSGLAETEHEKDLMIWFAQKDQDIFGIGIVGFDVSDMGWKKEIFEAQKSFILEVIDSAAQKTGWEKLNYSPKEDRVLPVLKELREMIMAFSETHAENAVPLKIYPFEEKIMKYDRCEKHRVYLHTLGCIVCNNAALG